MLTLAVFAVSTIATAMSGPALSFADPLNGAGRATSGYGARIDPMTGRNAFHAGQDIAAETGTAVGAAAAGEVTVAEFRGPYGNLVEIVHPNSTRTRYGHLSRIDVAEGQTVSEGMRVGAVGSTGRSNGAELHFEVWANDTAIDPKPLIRWVRRGPVVPN
jgi:murein DD-endopeptidase MepM/ murein hydrolase activator NlpD